MTLQNRGEINMETNKTRVYSLRLSNNVYLALLKLVAKEQAISDKKVNISDIINSAISKYLEESKE